MKMMNIIFFMGLIMVLAANITRAELKRIDFIDSTINGTDTYMNENDANANNGGNPGMFAGMTSPPKKMRTLLNLSFLSKGAIPSGSTINDLILELRINFNEGAVSTEDLRIYPVNYTWAEDTITWNSFGANTNMSEFNGTKNLIKSIQGVSAIGTRFNISLDLDYSQNLFNGNLGAWKEGLIFIHTAEQGSSEKLIGFDSSDDATTEDRWMIYVNYTESQTDSSAPSINVTYNITQLNQGDMINISAVATDNVNLSFCQIITNQTGGAMDFFNFSLSGTQDSCSQNFSISLASNNVINFTVRVNDSSNNFNQTETYFTVGDTIAPSIINFSLQRQPIMNKSQTNTLSILCEDTGSFLGSMNFTLAYNQSGSNSTTNFTRIINFLSPGGFGASGTGIRNIHLDTNSYIWNYSIFATDETAMEGNYNLTDVGCRERSGNSAKNDSTNKLAGYNFLMDTPPIINSQSPSDNGTVTASSTTGNAVITEDNPSFMLIFHNITGTFHLNQTINYSGDGTTQNAFNLSDMENGKTYAYSLSINSSFGTWTNTSNFSFSFQLPVEGGVGGGGGGGGTSITNITILGNLTPIISFGIATASFFVITTPSQSQKLILLKNVGTANLTNANIFIVGGAKSFLKPEICNIDLTICQNASFNINSGENVFMRINGDFDKTLDSGSEGIIRIQGLKTFDLPVTIDRPPFYDSVVRGVRNSGLYQEFIFPRFGELPAFIGSYALMIALIALGVQFLSPFFRG